MSTIQLTEVTSISLSATIVSGALQITYQTQAFSQIDDTFYHAGSVSVSLSDFTSGGVDYSVFVYSVGAGVSPWSKTGATNSKSVAVPGVDLTTELDFVAVAISPDGETVLHALDPKIRIIRRA